MRLKSKALKISIIAAAICIVAAAVLLIYYNSTHYIINLKSDNVSKIVYWEYLDLPSKTKYIAVTNKNDIQKILDVYNGAVFKPDSMYNVPCGGDANVRIYDKNNKEILEVCSNKSILFIGQKFYSNFGQSENVMEQYDKQLQNILIGYTAQRPKAR